MIIFFVIQFYRPNKNSESISEEKVDFLSIHQAPNNVKKFFIDSCYDCHSNNTDYHWYDNIAPVSWWIDNNIKKGKNSVNFSQWKDYGDWRKLSVLSAIEFNLNTERMPTKEYLYMHSDALLTRQQKASIISWINTIDRSKFSNNNH